MGGDQGGKFPPPPPAYHKYCSLCYRCVYDLHIKFQYFGGATTYQYKEGSDIICLMY